MSYFRNQLPCLTVVFGFFIFAGRDGISSEPNKAIAKLQKLESGGLIEQQDLDHLIQEDGGGACATAASLNAIQTLREMCGLQPIQNLHRTALAIFKDHPKLLRGRVANGEFVRAIESLGTQLRPHSIAVAVESAHGSPYRDGAKLWSAESGLDMTIKPNELKILSFTVSEPAGGTVHGRHFVLLKDTGRNEITVNDPGSPGSDRRYVIESRVDTEGAPVRTFLLTPAGIPTKPLVRELNTVFTVSVTRASEAVTNRPTVDDMKRKFDETAKKLRGTDEFLSPVAWRSKTAQFGLPALDLPADVGGLGWTALEALEVFRHAGEHNLNFRDVVGGAHARALLKSAHPEVRSIVRQVATGKGYVAIAITEPTAGSDVSAIKSTARRVPGGFRISGEKKFNARLDEASHVIIFTQGSIGTTGKLSVFVLPITTPGLKVSRLTAHGLTGNSFGGLNFDDVFVPESHMIGEDGEGLRVFFDHFLYWRLMQTAAAIGCGQNALKQMADRIRSREAFGAPIARFTHLQQPIGQHTTELQMAFSLAKEAANLLDRGESTKARAIICGLKAEGVEIAIRSVDAAMRAFGGEGYSTLVDLGDRLRDLNGLRIADGTTDVMRMEVVRQTFGQEFWELAIQPRNRE